MRIELKLLKENEDGSADCSFEMDQEAKEYIINYGLIEMLKEAAKIGKTYSLENKND